MDVNTFGDSKQYKMLEYLTEKIDLLDDKDKKYLSTKIIEFNNLMNQLLSVTEPKLKNYLLKLILKDYLKRIDGFKYDDKVISYLNNYIKARIKNAQI